MFDTEQPLSDALAKVKKWLEIMSMSNNHNRWMCSILITQSIAKYTCNLIVNFANGFVWLITYEFSLQ
jgi:hypothetical protein